MANVDAPAAVTPTPRKAGAPRKWIPVEGETMTTAMKNALADRERSRKLYEANRDEILEKRRKYYKDRMARYHAAVAFTMAWENSHANENATAAC